MALGSPLYVPPEMIKREKYGFESDIWSAGVVIYLIISGEYPYSGLTADQIGESILKNEVEFNAEVWKNVSHDAIDFLKKALAKN